jgi:hypothetical protein
MKQKILFLTLMYSTALVSMATEEITSLSIIPLNEPVEWGRVSFEPLKGGDELAELLESNTVSRDALAVAWLTPNRKRALYYGSGSAFIVAGGLGMAFSMQSLQSDSDKPAHALAFLASTIITCAGVALVVNAVSEEEFYKKYFTRKKSPLRRRSLHSYVEVVEV